MKKIALALIVKGQRNSFEKEGLEDQDVDYFKECLATTAKHFDKIFVTITTNEGEKPNPRIVEIAKAFNCEISEYVWDNNFANARNYNFKQVPKEYEYIMWLDADDTLIGGENLKGIIEKHPQVDAFNLYYIYHADERGNPDVVHQKTQVVKNNGCVEWNSASSLHEDFKPTRKINIKLVDDKFVKRVHLADDEKFDSAKKRNLEISKKMVEDLPEDPRVYWNLGNSQKALGMNKEAIETFNAFNKLSQSDDEKYIAKLRVAEAYWGLEKFKEAIEHASIALGTFPMYPDAYNLLGALYLESKQFEKAVEVLKQGLKLEPPYTKILVFNPRDYDYVPMMNLAKAYFNLELPTLALPLVEACLKIQPHDDSLKELVKTFKKESKKFDKIIKVVQKIANFNEKKKLKEYLDGLDIEVRSHPKICNIYNINFKKEKSSGKDLVILCAYTSREWTPDSLSEGIGGSEEAVIHLSEGLSKKGWNVTVYNNCGYKEQKFGDVTYKPYWTWNYRDKQDVTVLWRNPTMADYPINSDKIFVDLHDVIPAGEFTEERLKKIDKVFVKSKFHKGLFPNIPEDKFVIIPNGIWTDKFKAGKKKPLLINTSSPDRGLKAFTELFRKIKKIVPEAEAKWCYGWGVWDTVNSQDVDKMKWKNDLIVEMAEAGVENLGQISHDEIIKLNEEAMIYFYPSEFAEIDCISLTKAMASGCIPVTTDFAAMGDKKSNNGVFLSSEKTVDTWALPYQFDFSVTDPLMKQRFVDACVLILQGKTKFNKEELIKQAKSYDWDKIVESWYQEL